MLVKCRSDQVRRWKGERTRLKRMDDMFFVIGVVGSRAQPLYAIGGVATGVRGSSWGLA